MDQLAYCSFALSWERSSSLERFFCKTSSPNSFIHSFNIHTPSFLSSLLFTKMKMKMKIGTEWLSLITISILGISNCLPCHDVILYTTRKQNKTSCGRRASHSICERYLTSPCPVLSSFLSLLCTTHHGSRRSVVLTSMMWKGAKLMSYSCPCCEAYTCSSQCAVCSTYVSANCCSY